MGKNIKTQWYTEKCHTFDEYNIIICVYSTRTNKQANHSTGDAAIRCSFRMNAIAWAHSLTQPVTLSSIFRMLLRYCCVRHTYGRILFVTQHILFISHWNVSDREKEESGEKKISTQFLYHSFCLFGRFASSLIMTLAEVYYGAWRMNE